MRCKPPTGNRSKYGSKNGQTLVLFAISITVVFAMLAVAIDAGFLWGQRRFMQNAADSAALASATLLANNVAKYVPSEQPGNIPVYFLVTDQQVRELANAYVQRNQNPGLATRTITTTFQLYYFVTTDGNYNGDLTDLAHNAWVESPAAGNRVPDGTYRVRVVPSTTLENLFGAFVGQGLTQARATATAGIYGADDLPGGSGKLWPLTAWDHTPTGGPEYDFADPLNINKPVELWNSDAPYEPDGKQVNLGSFKNILDLSTAAAWNDGATSDYGFPAPLPDGTNTLDWHRDGFSPDPTHPGTVQSYPDVAWWVAHFFQGTAAVDDQFPLYTDTIPGQAGDMGQNVAKGIWGVKTTKPSGAWPVYQPDPDLVVGGNTAEGCTFCDPNQLEVDPVRSGTPTAPIWGRYRVVLIALWNNPQWWVLDNVTEQWHWVDYDDKAATGPPQRVQITKFHAFKVYESLGTSNSRVYGLWTSATLPPGNGGGGPPSSWFNSVRLVE